MGFYENNLNLIYSDFNKFYEFSVLRSQPAGSAQGRFYLQITEGHLEFTHNKTEKASKKQILSYLNALQRNIYADEQLNANVENKKFVRKQFTDIFNKYYITFDKSFECGFDNTLNDTMTEFEIAIEKDHPFYDTDLIVFKDNYKGIIPLNGIKETEFKEISYWISQLEKEKRVGSLSIELGFINLPDLVKYGHAQCPDPERFFDEICRMAIDLATRRIGREILREIINREDSKTTLIHGLPNSEVPSSVSCSRAYESGSIDNFIIINNYSLAMAPIYPGEKDTCEIKNDFLCIIPPFISLGHELCHARNYNENFKACSSRAAQLKNRMYDGEEFLAVEGREDEPQPEPIDDDLMQKMEDRENWDILLNEYKGVFDHPNFKWTSKCENGLRSVFDFQPRYDYEGFVKDFSNREWFTSFKRIKIRERAEGAFRYFNRKTRDSNFYCFSQIFTPSFIKAVDQYMVWSSFVEREFDNAATLLRWDFAAQLKNWGLPNFDRSEPTKLTFLNEEWGKTLDRHLFYAMVQQKEYNINALVYLGADPAIRTIDRSEWFNKLKEFCLEEIANTREEFQKNSDFKWAYAKRLMTDEFKGILIKGEWKHFFDQVIWWNLDGKF